MLQTKLIENYWNNKHPKSEIIYGGRAIRGYGARIPVDVRRMVWSDDYILKNIIKENNLIRESFDDTALACQRFVCSILKYVGDQKSSNIDECWQYPNESVVTKTGDCEDGSLLMGSLMINCGIPSWRVRVTAGMVQESPTAQSGGHAYVTYCRESDNNWVICDWCYFQDSNVTIRNKPLAKSVKTYKDIWFSFNNDYSWSHKSYDIIEHIKEEPTNAQ